MNSVNLPSDVIGVIAGFLPVSIDALRPLMLVSNSWFRGVVEQDGMRPKPGVYWPWIALEQRHPTSITLDVAHSASVADVCSHLPQLQDLIIRGPVKDPETLTQLHALKQLTSLRLSGCSSTLIGDVISPLEECGHRLRSLALKDFRLEEEEEEQAEDMAHLAETFPNLTSLTITKYILGLKDEGMEGLSAAGLKSLHTLNLRGCDNVTPEGISHLLNGLCSEHLTELSLRAAPISVENAEQLSKFHLLKSLDISEANITNDHLRPLASLKNLTSFNVARNDVSDLRQIICNCPALTHLDAAGANIIDVSLEAIAEHLPHLTHLDLGYCPNLTNAGLKHLAAGGLPHLTTLKLPETVSTEGLEHTARIQTLTKLEIYGHTALKDDDMRLVGKLKNLREFSGHFDNITNDGVKHLAQSKIPLRTLTLQSVGKVSDQGVEHIVNNFPSLTALNVCYSDITDVAVQFIATNLPHLTHLFLTMAEKVTDVGVQAIIDSLPQLAALNLDSVELVTDAGLANILTLHRLMPLNVSSCPKLTDATLERILELELLQSLDISMCSGMKRIPLNEGSEWEPLELFM